MARRLPRRTPAQNSLRCLRGRNTSAPGKNAFERSGDATASTKKTGKLAAVGIPQSLWCL